MKPPQKHPHRADPGVPRVVRGALRRRGLNLRTADLCGDKMWIDGCPPELQDRLYELLQRYSFRLVLRDVIRFGQQGRFHPEALARHASLTAVQQILQSMSELKLVQPQPDGQLELALSARNLGPTLEWLVAEVLRRELDFEVARNVPLRGGSTGGDLDVVACAEGLLLYVEVKSGPPKHIDSSQVAAFLDRVEAIAPHGAIFFEDTELRMKDKIVVLFTEELQRRGVAQRPRRLQRELFCVGPAIFIANAHPDITANLSCCVVQLLRHQGIRLKRQAGQRGTDD